MDGRIPLAPKMWSRINKIEKIKLCYHTTDLNGYKTLIKLQGKNSQISTFTRGDWTVASGVDTTGGVLVELEGDSTLQIDGDAWTSLSRSGVRWWDLTEMSESGSKGYILLSLRDRVRKEIKDLISNEFPQYFEGKNIMSLSADKITKIIENDFKQKDKGIFVGKGIKLVESIIASINFQEIIDIANSVGRDIFGDSNDYFNEIVLHNFKIKNVYGIVRKRVNVSEEEDYKIYSQLDNTIKLDGWTRETWIEDVDNTKVETVSTLDELV